MNLRFTILDLGFERGIQCIRALMNSHTPHPNPVAFQARHKSVSRKELCASRNVVPVEGRRNYKAALCFRRRYAMFTIISLMELNGNGILQSFIL